MEKTSNRLKKSVLHNDNIGIAMILIVLCVITTAINPSFASKLNIINMLRKLAQVAFIAVSMTFVMIGGGIDLSVGATAGLGGVVAGALMVRDVPVALAVLIALAIGALLGLFNGVMVARVGIPPFIVTLGTMYIAEGLVNVISLGKPIFPLPESFTNVFSEASFLGIPITVYAMLLFIIAMHYLLNHTVYGRSITATGGNEKATSTAGINVIKTRVISYVMMSTFACFTGLLIAGRMKTAHPASGGGWEMKAIAAAVIGGTSVTGGSGSVVGTIIGAAIMAVLETSMTMIKVPVYYQNIVVGVIIIAAVVFDQMKRRKNK